jgi:hypothetical protein
MSNDEPLQLLARSESSSREGFNMAHDLTPRPNRDADSATTKILVEIQRAYEPVPPTTPHVTRVSKAGRKKRSDRLICLEQENADLKKRVKELEKQQDLRCKIVREAPKLIGLIDSLSKEQKRNRMIIISLRKDVDIQKDQNKQAFREISELTCSISCMLAGTPMPTIIPEYPSGDGLTEKDIKLVIEQACVGRAIAIEALEKNNGDLVDAIMDLTMLN